MSNSNLIRCSTALARLSEFLAENSDIIKVCMVDFISKNIFQLILSVDIAEELGQMSDEQIIAMPERCSKIQENYDPSTASPLDKLLFTLSLNSLENLKVVTSRAQASSRFVDCSETSLTLQHFDRIASDKKMHEVVVMSDIISRLATSFTIDSVIDLGSGKGYLSHVFATTHKNVQVLAIEGSDSNSEGAKKRKLKLEKRWDGLLRRALCRASGQEPPTRGKKWKSRQAQINADKLEKVEMQINTDVEDQTDIEMNSESRKNMEQKNTKKSVDDNLRFVTQFVDESTDIDRMITENFIDKTSAEVHRSEGKELRTNLTMTDERKCDSPTRKRHFEGKSPTETERQFGIVGLHTCGPLASSSLKIFLAKDAARFCCNVGCCYHLLREESDGLSEDKISFPLSSVLKSNKFSLGRNPLMLASQPMDRSIANKELPDRALFWRSALQVLLLRHKPNLKLEDQQVGRIAAKSKDFSDYVKKALEKLQLGIQIPENEIVETYTELELQHRQKLNSFYQLRSLFAPLIEGLVLLDRLVYLLEQETVSEAYLVKLFDPVISPRCYALIGIKK